MIKQINKAKKKLNDIIKNNGLCSEKTLKVSEELDLLIAQYYNNDEKYDLKM